jgi:hypothetical protein
LRRRHLRSGAELFTIDGGTNGIIRNTANATGNAHNTEMVDIHSCNHCTVQNLHILDVYVRTSAMDVGGTLDETQQKCIEFSGSNLLIKGNTLNNAGWCLFDSFGNGDTNIDISFNTLTNFAHAIMYATAGTNASTNIFIHDNDFGGMGATWNGAGCPFHQDGLHAFGVAGSSIDNFYFYNNYFHGDWGQCPTGWVFIEAAGSGTPSNMKNSFWWNNVGIVNATGQVENTNGWFNVSAGNSGQQQFFNNTIMGPGVIDNTACFSLNNLSGVTFKNNVVSNCGDPIATNAITLSAMNNNFYGPSCFNGNCFVWNGSFTGSFANWKQAVGGSFETQSVQNNNALLNAGGSPQSGSPVIGLGANLATLATGNLASLASGTSQGNQRTPVARPGNGSGAWIAGAYAYAGPPPPAPTLSLTKTTLSFSGTTGGSNPATQTLSVSNSASNGSTLSWTGASSAPSWLSLSPTSGGNGPTTVTVSATIASLAAGTYNGTLTFTDGNATNNPQTVSVTLTLAAGQPIPTLSNGLPSTSQPSGTTQATLQVNTDVSAACRYSTIANTAFGSMTNNLTPSSGNKTHSTVVTGLVDGTSYHYYVRCQNTADTTKVNSVDYPISFSVNVAGNNAPVIGPITINPPDVDNTTAGIQELENTTVSYGATIMDADPNDTITWSWVYSDGTTTFTAKTGTGQGSMNATTNYTYPLGSAGKTYTWTLNATDAKVPVSKSVVVTVVSATSGNPNGLLTPDLGNIDGKTFRTTDDVVLSYGGQASGFNWQITSLDGAASIAASLRASAVGDIASVSTQAPRLSISGESLTPGHYQIQVQATNATQSSNWSAPARISVVSGDSTHVKVYPNPWRKDKHAGKNVIFTNLPANCTIKVFTVSGHLVKDLGTASGTTAWDLMNDGGDKVASGIYSYLIKDSEGNNVKGKFAVMR